MIWSEQELANMAIGGKSIAIERVIKQLDNPENKDIFLKKNFSFLWGILGVTGLEDASENAKEKIWQSLKENGAVDAYDKGILADFTHRIAAKYGDNRVMAWLKMDNFEAGRFFNRVILKELFNTNEKLEVETISYCYDEIKLISSLANGGISSKLKIYLESLRKQEAGDFSSGTVLTKVFEKEMALRKLTDVIVTSNHTLSEDDKSYLFYYLREAVASGFDMNRIGLDDQVLSRLMGEFRDKEIAEVEAQPMLTRNADILDFVLKAEETSGFFEQCASKVIHTDKTRIPVLIERCLYLIKIQNQPKGVVFALELINLGQIKSAVIILEELAKKGVATEMACFLHRLLPQAKGAEKILLGILQMNLRNQHTRNPWGDNAFFFEYITRRYLQAARAFAEIGFYKESAGLLQEIVLGKWFEAQDDLIKEFLGLTNWLLYQDKSLEKDLDSSIKKLNLQIFREGDAVFVGTETDNPITAARHRLEQKIKTATTFDVGGVLDKMSKAEASTYGMFKNFKQAFAKNKNGELTDELPPISVETIDEVFAKIEANKAENSTETQISEAKIETPALEDKKEVADNLCSSNDVITMQETDVKNDDEKSGGRLSVLTKKIKLSNVLSDNIHELGDGLEKIKQVTSSALKKFDKTNQQEDKENVLPADNNTDKVPDNREDDSLVYAPEQVTPPDESDSVIEKARDLPVINHEENGPVIEEVPDSTLVDNISDNARMVEDTPVVIEKVIADTGADTKENSVDNNMPSFETEVTRPNNEAVASSELSESILQDANKNSSISVEDVSIMEEQAYVEKETADDVEHIRVEKPELSKPLVSNIQSWDDEITENTDSDDKKIAKLKNKVNISKILKIKSEDVDKQFDRIRKITSSAVKKAEEQVARVKKRVEDTNIANSQSIDKIKNIAKKIKLFKKK